MIKKIIKLPNGKLGLEFTLQESKKYGFVIGDSIDLSDVFLVRRIKDENKNN